VIWTDSAGESGNESFLLSRSELSYVSPELQPVGVSEANVLCALARPERFVRAVRKDVRIATELLLPDHDPLTSGSLFDRLPEALPTIVTAKDWVKLRARPDIAKRTFVVARQEVRVEPEREFGTWLESKLHGS
jgi:tetraacyldisaccharide-1-P 4'-kinase